MGDTPRVADLARSVGFAVELHFEGMAEDGDPPPKARGVECYRKLIKHLDVSQFFLGHVQIDASRFTAAVGAS